MAFGQQRNRSPLQNYKRPAVQPPGGVRSIPAVPPPRTLPAAGSYTAPGAEPLPTYDAVRASLMAKTAPVSGPVVPQQQWTPPPSALPVPYQQGPMAGPSLQKKRDERFETRTSALSFDDIINYAAAATDPAGWAASQVIGDEVDDSKKPFTSPYEGIKETVEKGKSIFEDETAEETPEAIPEETEGPQGALTAMETQGNPAGYPYYKDEDGTVWVKVGDEFYKEDTPEYFKAVDADKKATSAEAETQAWQDKLQTGIDEASTPTNPWDLMGAKQWQQEMDLIDKQSEADFEAAMTQASYAAAAAGVSYGGTSQAAASSLSAKLNLQKEAAKQQLFNDQMALAVQTKLATLQTMLALYNDQMTTQQKIDANMAIAKLQAQDADLQEKIEYVEAGLGFLSDAHDNDVIDDDEYQAKVAEMLGADSQEEVAAIIASVSTE